MGHRTDRISLAGRAGFSLLELVLVVAVLAIVAAIAAPRYANTLANQRLEAAARRIVADLALAQRQAKFSGTSQTVSFDASKSSYRLAGVQKLDRSAGDYTVALAGEPYQVSIVSASFGADAEIIYDGYGVPDSGGTVTIQAGGYQMVITVDADTGRASGS